MTMTPTKQIYLTWSEYFRSKEFLDRLKKYNYDRSPKIRFIATWK